MTHLTRDGSVGVPCQLRQAGIERQRVSDFDSNFSRGVKLGMGSKRRHGRVAQALVVALSCGLVAVLAMRPSNPPPPFRVGTQGWVGYAPAYLARQAGEWMDGEVSIVELPTDAATVRAMRAGGLEAACLTLDGAFRVQAARIDVRVVAVLDYSAGADAVLGVPRSGLTTVSDLRGKRVGVERHGVGMLFLARVLRSAGLTVDDVTVVNADLSEHDRLVASGRVDAVVTYSPHKERLLAAGARVVCDSARFPAQVIDVLVVRVDAFARNPGAVRNLMRGWWAAADRLAAPGTHPGVAKAMGITPDELADGYRQVRILARAESARLVAPPAPELFPAAGETAAALRDLGVIDGPIDPARLFLTPAEVDLIR